MISVKGEAKPTNYMPGDFIYERPAWVPGEVWETLTALRAKVLESYEPLSNYDTFSQEPHEIARRLAILERLGTDKKMKAVWEYLSKRARDSSLQGTPYTGNPFKGVSEGAYRRCFPLENNEVIPDSHERLRRARKTIVEETAKYIMKPDPILRERSYISPASLKREAKELGTLLEAAGKIRARLMSPGRGEIWGFDMPAALQDIVWALETDLKENETKYYQHVSGNEGSLYSQAKVHVVRLNGLVLSLFEEPLPSLVAALISVAMDANITRQDVEAMIGQYGDRILEPDGGKKKPK
jgi:hypothetical protein